MQQEPLNLEPSYLRWTRVIWCPYMPDEEADADGIDNAKMLVLLHGTRVSINHICFELVYQIAY